MSATDMLILFIISLITHLLLALVRYGAEIIAIARTFAFAPAS